MQDEIDASLSMWNISTLSDPLLSYRKGDHHHLHHRHKSKSSILSASASIRELLGNDEKTLTVLREGGRGARVALSDFAARQVIEKCENSNVEIDGVSFSLEPLDRALIKTRHRRMKGRSYCPPYVLERTDFWCSETDLHVMIRLIAVKASTVVNEIMEGVDDESNMENAARNILTKIVNFNDSHRKMKLLRQVACVTLQERLRSQLASLNAVAFVADGSILPRRSGTSDAPMKSPPAIPFKAPPNSSMSQEISIEMGSLVKYLQGSMVSEGKSSVTLPGLVVPAGITLICGGGYHGKSTLLRTIAMGVYNKIPGDGREFCVAVQDAVMVRAEDGRYVNNCNISAFISNLPTPPGVERTPDTKHFSSRDASGSTSQAANVAEAIEMGASAMLVDEDVSAANFMARDGRMRALVMDESITPLLYRVNGLYNTHKISSVVVVGGVGDWLDVPHNVILLDKYVASDATKKARSISYQFSYGHVQYGGRGVVHRLEWDKEGTPFPRRPVDTFSSRFESDVIVSLMDGGHAISLHRDDDVALSSETSDREISTIENMIVDEDEDEDEGCIEASRLEQMLGRKQLYGCGLCVAWILQTAPKNPKLGIPALLDKLDELLDTYGMAQVLNEVNESTNMRNGNMSPSGSWKQMLEGVGFAQRPRRYEVGQALTRMHGIQMEEIPVEDDGLEEAARLEEERKKKALADLWANRRKKR